MTRESVEGGGLKLERGSLHPFPTFPPDAGEIRLSGVHAIDLSPLLFQAHRYSFSYAIREVKNPKALPASGNQVDEFPPSSSN